METAFYKPRNTLNLEMEDFRVCLIGKIVEIGENYFLLEDEFGKIRINYTPSEELNEKIKKNSLVRVFCTKIDSELYCDFLQNLEGFDLNLYRKIENLYFNLL